MYDMQGSISCMTSHKQNTVEQLTVVSQHQTKRLTVSVTPSGLNLPPPEKIVESDGNARTALFSSPHFHSSLLTALASSLDRTSARGHNFLQYS